MKVKVKYELAEDLGILVEMIITRELFENRMQYEFFAKSTTIRKNFDSDRGSYRWNSTVLNTFCRLEQVPTMLTAVTKVYIDAKKAYKALPATQVFKIR